MTKPLSTVGVDYQTDSWLIARVRHEGGRPTIEQLLRCHTDQLASHDFLRTDPVTLTVPDDRALVKQIRLNGGGDQTRLAAFELSQAVLAEESEFAFDSFPTGLSGLTIGTAIRRSVLTDEIIEPFTNRTGGERTPLAILRAIAFGRGYNAFAVSEGGELTALIDTTSHPVSLCIVHGGRPVAVGYLAADRFNLDDEAGRQRMAIELKTVINFKLASLFEHGLTLPLSGLVVAGDDPDDLLLSSLRRYFAVRVTRPQLNTGFLADPEQAETPGGGFWAALGLTAI